MKRWVLFSLLLTAAAGVSAWGAWQGWFGPLPDPIPTHWNFAGQPDEWVARDKALPYLLIPTGLMALMIVLGFVLPWLSPKKFDIETFRPTFEHVMLLLVGMFGYLHVVLLLMYLKPDIGAARLMVGGMMLFFAFLGNVMGQVKRNFWIGVRTPWTLASDLVWNRTHRIAAWIWVPGSVVLSIAILAGFPLEWSVVPFFGMILYPVLYSLWLYKRLQREGKLGNGEQEAAQPA